MTADSRTVTPAKAWVRTSLMAFPPSVRGLDRRRRDGQVRRRRDVGQPPVEPGRSEPRAGTRHERIRGYVDAVIRRRRIRDHLTRIAVVGEHAADRRIE